MGMFSSICSHHPRPFFVTLDLHAPNVQVHCWYVNRVLVMMQSMKSHESIFVKVGSF